jgi:hypothetical protein
VTRLAEREPHQNTGYTEINADYLPLVLTEKIKSKGYIHRFVKAVQQNNIIVELNHSDSRKITIVSPINYNNWFKTTNTFTVQAKRKGIPNGDILDMVDVLDNNHEIVLAMNGNGKGSRNDSYRSSKDTDEEECEELPRKDIYIDKYSNGIPLAEAIVLDRRPRFLQLKEEGDNTPLISRKISTVSKVLYPKDTADTHNPIPYIFESLDELNSFLQRASKESIETLYFKVKSVIEKYIDTEEDCYISLIAADIVISYFQDKFSTMPITICVGDNESGKNSILLVFRCLGYRVFYVTAASAANYYTFLGEVEEGQGTIAEDEADNIHLEADKRKILKTGYASGGSVPKVDLSSGRTQDSWLTYCKKYLAMEDLPDPKVIKGVLSRAFILECVAGRPKYNIKSVIKYAGDSKYKPLYDELLDVRKLLFAYRMQHFSEVIPDVSLNIRNRDEELAKPYIRLFQNSPNALKEVQSTLSYFLSEKNKLKRNSIEAKLLRVILSLIDKEKQKNQSQLPPDKDIYFIENGEIWTEVKNEMNGTEIPGKPQSFYSVEYGVISHSAISRRLKTKFKGKPTQSGRGYENRRGFNFSKNVLDKIALAYESPDSIEILSEEDDIDENSNIDNNDAKIEDIQVTKVTEVTHSNDRQGIIEDIFDVNESKRTILKEDKDNNNNTSSTINSNPFSHINDNKSKSTQTIRQSENIENNPHLPIRRVTSVTSVTNSRPSSLIYTRDKEKDDNNNTTLLSGLPKIPCIFCTYSNPIRFDLELHLIEKHRMDLVKLRIGKASMEVRIDYAIELGASRLSIDKEEEEDDGTCDEENDEEEKDVNDDY